MEDLPDGVSGLATRLEALERRVFALEHPAPMSAAVPNAVVDECVIHERVIHEHVINHAVRDEPMVPAGTSAGRPASGAAGMLSILGRALLGIAGAYLLRALAESDVLPKIAIAAVAIVYALAWLVWATRAKSGELMASTIYSCTSAVILVPMLWELTLRFHVLSEAVIAGVIAFFVIAGSVMSRRRNVVSVAWIANLVGAVLSLALSVATRQMIPFIGVLLLMTLIHEYDQLRGRAMGARIVASLAADLAIWASIFIYAGQQSTRTSYPQLSSGMLIGPAVILFLISGAGVLYSCAFAGKQISVFEIVQVTTAFLLASCAAIWFGPRVNIAVIGVLCLILSGAGYWLVLRRLKENQRNLLVFATWSGALMVAGSAMALPAKVMPPWLGCWAVAAAWAGAKPARLQLQAHALVFLLVAAAGSGMLVWMAGQLAGPEPETAAPLVYFAMACAVVCYALTARAIEPGWRSGATVAAFAALTLGAMIAIAVQGLTALLALEAVPEAHHLAFIRTLAVCLAAVSLAFSGAHWGRAELTKIGYAVLVLLVLKLAVEDLRHGRLTFIAASIFLFAITLIAVPRAAKMKPARRPGVSKPA